MRSARRVGEAGTHPTPTDHVRWPTQTASSGESEGKNRVNSDIQRLTHPGRGRACATHRAFSFACVGATIASERWEFVQANSKQTMKQVLGIKNEAARMKVTPPLAVAPLAHGDDMRWNPALHWSQLMNDNGIDFNP